MRVGSGYDLHRFGPGDHVRLGGVRVPHDRGLIAHSDGDVLLHALMDALLGAAGAGDIGQHFPADDPRYSGADSRGLLREVMKLVSARGFEVVNCDLTLISETPSIAPHREAICANVALDLDLDRSRVNLKATTAEGIGALGRAEGIAAHAIVLLKEGDGA
jgi:2-C-methyl-D-erythritol 2,4-cyclodiphosphate synthase